MDICELLFDIMIDSSRKCTKVALQKQKAIFLLILHNQKWLSQKDYAKKTCKINNDFVKFYH